MRNYITQAFEGFTAPFITHVKDAHYDIIKEHLGLVIIPSVWAASVKPGQKLVMHMWYMNDLPRPRPPSTGPRGMNTGRPIINPPPPRFNPVPRPPVLPPSNVPRFNPPSRPMSCGPVPRWPPPRGPAQVIEVDPPRRRNWPLVKRNKWMTPQNKSDSDSDSDSNASEDSEHERKVKERAELAVVDFLAMLKASAESKEKGKRVEHEGGEFGQFLEKMINISDTGSMQRSCVNQMWSGDSSSSDFELY